MRKALLIVSVAVFGLSFGGGEQAVSTFTDKRDGKVYRIVEIGGAVWMAENLNFATKRSVWMAENLNSAAKGSVCYDNKAANCAKYGRLYDWETALEACPAGFHLPSDVEWTALVDYAGGSETAGTTLKSSTGWNSDEDIPTGTNEYGFSALPGGFRDYNGRFNEAGEGGTWWEAAANCASSALNIAMNYDYEGVYWEVYVIKGMFSVRCVQDKEGEQ